MNEPAKTGWGRFVMSSALAGAGAAALLALWITDHTLLASTRYRQSPGQLIDLGWTALWWYLPLLISSAVGIAVLLRLFRKSWPPGSPAAIGVALFTATYGLGAFFGPTDAPLAMDWKTLSGLLALAAAAVAAGCGAVELAHEARRSERTALLIRSLCGLTAALLTALSLWSLLREALEFQIGHWVGLVSAGLCLAAGGIAGALVFLLAGAGIGAWARLAAASGGALIIGAGLGLLPVQSLLGPVEAVAEAGRAAASRPNLILIVSDTLRADRVEAYGASRTRTPAIDALAGSGVRFSDVSATASWTFPTTASILTGLYPSTHGLMTYKDVLRPEAISLAAVLKRAGYATAGFVANPVLGPESGVARGFDRWEHRMGLSAVSRHKSTALAGSLRKLGLWQPEQFFPRASTAIERSREWLSGREEEPFFLYLHLMDPHDPYAPPSPYDAMYGREPDDGFSMTFGTLPTIQAGRMKVGPQEFESMMALYDGAISYMDLELGAFLDELSESGRLENTLVVFVADHGEEFIDHGGLGHEHTLYQELVHVPLIFSGSGVPEGAVIDEAVTQADLSPTILEALGLESPVEPDGISLWGAISRGEPLPKRDIFLEEIYIGQRSSVHHLAAVRRGPLKLIGSSFHAAGGEPWGWELYDLEADPGEKVDLMATFPEEAAGMISTLDRHASRPGAGRSGDAATSDERMELLRSLGYIE